MNANKAHISTKIVIPNESETTQKMYHKSNRIILIAVILIINFINELLANDQNTKQLLDLSDYQLTELSEIMCSELSEILKNEMDYEDCVKHYQSTRIDKAVSAQPLDLKIKCQTSTTSTFEIKPSSHRRLVILVKGSNERFDFVPYTLIEPYEQFGKLEHEASNMLREIWAATLDVDGKPLKWMKGPQIPHYNGTTLEHRNYNVSLYYTEFVEHEDTFIARTMYTWDRSDTDECYEVPFICEDSNTVATKKIWPTKNPVLILDLPIDSRCTIQVIGKYGTTVFSHNTLSCADSEQCRKTNKRPWAPENIDVLASEYGSHSWLVRVNWTQPKLLPQNYNVTLWTNETVSVVVDGNATEAIFKGVSGEGSYSVSVDATILNWKCRTNRMRIFPVASSAHAWAWWWGAAGAWALVLVAAMVAAACLACRRPTSSDKDLLYPEMIENIKEFDIEAFGSESGGLEDQWEVRVERLAVYEVVGEGAFGVVRRGTLTPHNREVAVKMLKDFPGLNEVRSFRAEMELMKSVGAHPHLVSLVGCCTGRRPLIVTEYCSRGDLLSYIRCSWDVIVSKRKAKYYNNNIDSTDYRNDLFKCKIEKEQSRLVVNKLYELQGICDVELTALDLLSFCRQIAMGMEFLASNKVVHRDLAARNVLVTGDRTLKIADFGLSRDVYEENQYKQKGNGKLPVKWMALESLTRQIYTTQSDVWSFGVVIWEIVTMGMSPYPEVPAARLLRLLRAGYRMRKPNNCSKELYDLMSACWRAHPRDRPTFLELHQRLDELLNCACADEYLSLEVDGDDAPTTPKSHRYLRMFTSGKRYFTRGESYERPLKPPQSNHYSSPPVILSKTPV